MRAMGEEDVTEAGPGTLSVDRDAPGAIGGSEIRDFETFRDVVATITGFPVEDLTEDARLVADMNIHEFMLFSLVLGLQDLNPYFEIPEQMDIVDVTLLDVYSFFVAMTPGHVVGEL